MGLRERYLHDGPSPLGDAEILALVLGTGTQGTPAIGVARGLLDRFGGVGALLQAEPAELAEAHGIGRARAIQLHAALELGRRARRVEALGRPVTTPDEAYAILGPPLHGLEDEELHALFLDRRRRVVVHRALTRGSHAFTIVDARQIFRLAVRTAASAVVLAHNHPSGDPEPSAQDRDVTHAIARAGKVLGVPLLDHLVVTDSGYTSMAERGHVPPGSGDRLIWTP